MRITNNMLSHNLLRNLEAAQGRMDQLQNQLASGYRITRPSDDPVGIENALRIKSSLSHVEQWRTNASEGLAYMNTTDTTLDEMTKVLQRAKELALQGVNGSMTEDDRKKVALEVEQLKEQMIQMANTRVGSKYIFGGTKNKEPFSGGDTTEWSGSYDVVKFQVGSSLSLEISINGMQLFGIPDPAPDLESSVNPENVGILKSFNDLLDGLNNSNIGFINDSIEGFENQADIVVNFRAQLGAKQNRMESLYEQLDATSLNLTQTLSDIVDADVAKTLVDFKSQESVYQAALSVGAKIIQPSLVDFMN